MMHSALRHVCKTAQRGPWRPQFIAPTRALATLTDADTQRLERLRNVGISAHIDSGKTTLTERILFYTGRISSMHEVRGKDQVGATMDHMELEREKGITIQSAATYCEWDVKTSPIQKYNRPYNINIIDTPGHVDFTIEVERALRVLDGAVLVLCAVSGVQSQTITVDRQMKRYNVPRIVFINKMDRQGADPERVVAQLQNKLKLNAAMLTVPMGAADEFEGVVDIVRGIAVRNAGEKGMDVIEEPIPEKYAAYAAEKRQELVEALANVDDVIGDAFLEERAVSNEELAAAIRSSTINLTFAPVFVGTALGNKGVQPLLDGLCEYLPDPSQVKNEALDIDPEKPAHELVAAQDAPLVGLAFKLEESPFGQLTYLRVYQGKLKKGSVITNARTKKRTKLPRLVRMHSNNLEDVAEIGAGEICAMFGIDCASGDTFSDSPTGGDVTLMSMYVPAPVVSLAIRPKGQETPNFGKALQRFQREDPTFSAKLDPESHEMIISGMGELHLEIYVERMRREYNVDVVTGRPKVAFRESLTSPVAFEQTFKKQSGGAGQYAKVIGALEPVDPASEEYAQDPLPFENQSIGGTIPSAFMPGIQKGFADAAERGPIAGFPITGVRLVVTDGAHHEVDSSELAFRICTQQAIRENLAKGGGVILEPVMLVEVLAPTEFQGAVISGINQRRGSILDSNVHGDDFTLQAEVALNVMFGYASALRSSTQGKGEFSMEYLRHSPVDGDIQQQLIRDKSSLN